MQKVKRTKETSQDYYEITDPRQFKALRSAIRQEVVDVMESLAPCTIAALADRRGLTVNELKEELGVSA